MAEEQAKALALYIAENTPMYSTIPDSELHRYVRRELADQHGITKPRISLVRYIALLTRLEWLYMVAATKALP